jgi:hypothetical protein
MSHRTQNHLTPLAPEDMALLELARGGFQEGPEDRARIQGKLALQLGAAAGLGASTFVASKAAAAAPGAASGTSLLVAKVVAGAALVTGLASIGVVLVRHPGTVAYRKLGPSARESTATSALLSAPPSVAAARTTMEARSAAPSSADTPDVPGHDEPALRAPTVAVAPSQGQASRESVVPHIPLGPHAPPLRTPADRAQVVPRVAPTATATPDPPRTVVAARPSPADDSETLPRAPRGPSTVDAEAALLRDADAALKAGRAERALALVEEHASRFPGGVLVEEREAERIVVLCALGRTEEARARASQFVRARPRSPLIGRIRTCGDDGT